MGVWNAEITMVLLVSLDIDISYELVMLILYIKSRETPIIYKSRDKNVYNNIACNSKTLGKTQMSG